MCEGWHDFGPLSIAAIRQATYYRTWAYFGKMKFAGTALRGLSLARVFISYRRDDAKWQAREIYRALVQVLPREHVFMDIDSIPLGTDFVDVLEGWVEQCDILLVLIGSGWADATDSKTGYRRLENPNDFVRIEVRKALARGVPVVPVLLDGAPMPDPDKLPADLKLLTRRTAEFVEHRTVDTDVDRLIRKLGLVQGAQHAQQTRQPTKARAEDTPREVPDSLSGATILIVHTERRTDDAKSAARVLQAHGANVKFNKTSNDGNKPFVGKIFYPDGLEHIAKIISNAVGGIEKVVPSEAGSDKSGDFRLWIAR